MRAWLGGRVGFININDMSYSDGGVAVRREHGVVKLMK